jgi:hypothetical protein
MFSLDVVRWRDKQQPRPNQLDAAKRLPSRELRRSRSSLLDERSEGIDRDDQDVLPNVHQDAQLQRDRRMKKLYGRTQCVVIYGSVRHDKGVT